MEVSERLKNKIIQDNEFSLKLALVLNTSQQWVIKMAKKGSKRLLLPDAIKFYKDSGFKSDSEIMNYKKN